MAIDRSDSFFDEVELYSPESERPSSRRHHAGLMKRPQATRLLVGCIDEETRANARRMPKGVAEGSSQHANQSERNRIVTCPRELIRGSNNETGFCMPSPVASHARDNQIAIPLLPAIYNCTPSGVTPEK